MTRRCQHGILRSLPCWFCERILDGAPRPGLNRAEAPPVPNDSRPIWELVIEDMRQRDEAGRAKYGTPLQANNGRDALIDAYQEALDLCVYLRQAIEERKHTWVTTGKRTAGKGTR